MVFVERMSNFGTIVSQRPNDKYNLSHNYIVMNNYVAKGIELLNLNNFYIEDNHVFINDNLTQEYGIHLANSHYNEVNCNEVVSSVTSTYPVDDQTAIFATKSSDIKYGCNVVDNTTNGIGFDEDCQNTEIFGNTIGNHKIGLLVGRYGLIGQQPLVYPGSDLPGNKWTGSYSLVGAQQLSHANISPYFYNFSGLYWQFGPPSVDPSNWFFPQPDNNFECGPDMVDGQVMDPSFCGHGTPEFTDGGSGLDERIAQGNVHFTAFEEQMQWSLKKYLYEKMKFFPDSSHTDSVFVEFYDSLSSSKIREFADVKEKEKEFFSRDEITFDYLKQKRTIIKENLALLENYFRTLNDPSTSPQDQSNLRLEISALQQNIDYEQTLIESVINTLELEKQLILNSADLINQGISTSEEIEQNLKNIRDVYFSTIPKNDYSFLADQVNTIEQIAEQCPISGGEAVYLARGLNALINPNKTYDDHNICLLQGILYRKAQKIENSSCRIVPNPASNEITFFYSIKTNDNLLRIFNNLGSIVKSIRLNPEKFSELINLNEFINGIYSLQLFDNNAIVYQGKLVVVK